MSERHEALANRVVDTFKGKLDDAARAAVGENNFTALNEMVREALSEVTEEAVSRLEEVIERLRTQIEKPDLGL